MYRSTDFGNTWALKNTPVEPLWVFDFCKEDPNTILTSRYYSPNCISVNGGTSYQLFNNPFTFINLYGIIFPEKNYAIAMFSSGIFKLKCINNVTVGINGTNEIIPENFYLFQNYPNPFNPETKIGFTIPNYGSNHPLQVNLTVYDILGKEVKVLINKEMSPGYHEVSFNGMSYPGGIYFYVLRTDSYFESKRMIMLK